jgi:signal transduction histidine kinase
MDELELLKTLCPIWLNRVVLAMTKGAALREDLRDQLERFFALLTQAVETGDPAWLDPILALWATSLTQSDLEEGASNLTRFINELMLMTFAICRETLDDSQALQLLYSILPNFTYAYQKAAQYEMEARTAYVAAQLEQTRQTLEKLDKSKSDFIAVAAHELKTPLTLIEGYASMLVENHERVNTDESELQLLNGVRNGTRRLRSIIDDMIDVSLIDTNLLLINFQPVWINRLLTALQNELGYSVKERNLELIINPFEGSDELTFGDPERLLQVFRNLISNAVKFTPDGGKIMVDGRKLPGFFEITISDTGIGIDPEDQMIIFDKFTRIGSTSLHSSGKTKFKGGGPGLGLHIAKGIIEGHGGAIWVESAGYDEKNCPGSTFHVMLPVRSVPPDDKMAKLFEPLIHNKQVEEKIQ